MDQLPLLRVLTESGGTWVIYLLLALSVLSLGVIIERVVIITRLARYQKTLLPKLDAQLQPSHAKDMPASLQRDSVLYPVLVDLLKHGAKGKAVLDERLETQISLQKRRLERNMVLIGTLGNNAPFIGLLGTVLGVIHSFQSLSQATGQGPEVVMAGLAEALIATAVGIMVALPCVAAYNFIQRRIKDVLIDADHFGKQFIAVLTER